MTALVAAILPPSIIRKPGDGNAVRSGKTF